MSRIFALVSVSAIVLALLTAFGSAVSESEADGEQFDALVGVIASGWEITTFIPLILGAALMIAVLGVLART